MQIWKWQQQCFSCRRSLKVDRHLLVKGTQDIFALGDASTIEQVIPCADADCISIWADLPYRTCVL